MISILTIIGVPLGLLLMLTPDLWCGQFANNVVAYVLGYGLMARTEGAGAEALRGVGFFEIYFTTVLEGLILSFMLFIFSFIAIIILQRKSLQKLYFGNVGGVGAEGRSLDFPDPKG